MHTRTKLVIECRKNVNMHHIQEKGLVQLIISAHHILHIFFMRYGLELSYI